MPYLMLWGFDFFGSSWAFSDKLQPFLPGMTLGVVQRYHSVFRQNPLMWIQPIINNNNQKNNNNVTGLISQWFLLCCSLCFILFVCFSAEQSIKFVWYINISFTNNMRQHRLYWYPVVWYERIWMIAEVREWEWAGAGKVHNPVFL